MNKVLMTKKIQQQQVKNKTIHAICIDSRSSEI